MTLEDGKRYRLNFASRPSDIRIAYHDAARNLWSMVSESGEERYQPVPHDVLAAEFDGEDPLYVEIV